ncbi:MAG: maleylpyruvate isomerase N-terminal domain-containing protein [Pseudonocardiaceae bacterium]
MQTARPRALADAPPTALAARQEGLAVPALASRGDSSWCGCCLSAHGSRWGSHGAPTPSTVGVRAWLAELRTGHLALPTPCSEWTVRQLLTHVIGGEYVYIDLPHVTRRATSQGPGCPHKTVPLGTTSRIRA